MKTFLTRNDTEKPFLQLFPRMLTMFNLPAMILRATKVTALTFLFLGLEGCQTITSPINQVVSYDGLTGNWEFVLSSGAGTVPFQKLAGFFYQASNESDSSYAVSAVFQLKQPSSCYAGAFTVPLHGSLQASALSLSSFSVNGQYLSIDAAEDSTITHLTGTYDVHGGCANTSAGTIIGTRYAPLTGSYSGTTTGSSAVGVQASLTQANEANGLGQSSVSGSANFTGVSCFTSGTLSADDGDVLGSSVSMSFITNEASGSKVLLTGTFDPAADTIIFTSAEVTGGSCSGSLGPVTLTKQ